MGSPDFLPWRQAGEPNLHRLLAVEVKYRANLSRFQSDDMESLVEQVRPQWPELYCVVVTDTPDVGRSCFQAFTLRASGAGAPVALVDLHEFPELDIYPTTVAEYEGLVRATFALLNDMA